jgi:CHC2 zinc finger
MNPSGTSEHLLIYLQTLAGNPTPAGCFDVRWRTAPGEMCRRFIPARDTVAAAGLLARLACSTDVYVGVALREGTAHGGRASIGGAHLLYVECDHEHIERSLAGFPYLPTLEVASGTRRHVHLYWGLRSRVTNLEAEDANRRLALRLGCDPASVDAARLLRPPGTFNHKHGERSPVMLIAYRADARYTLAQLMAGLPKPISAEVPGNFRARPACPARHGRSRTALDRQLRSIPTEDYVRLLSGRAPASARKVACPFHDDRDPSLHMYDGGSFYCFGCRRGGTIYDFAAHLWFSGEPASALRGRQFIEVRERLAALFFGDGSAATSAPRSIGSVAMTEPGRSAAH